MPPATASAPCDAGRAVATPSELLGGYQAALAARGAGNKSFYCAARSFLARWPGPQAWAAEPLPVRLAASPSTRPFLNYLMLSGQLHPGYDYLLERKLPAVLREAADGPLGQDRARFLAAAAELGYPPRVAAGLCSQIAMRMLIQAARPLTGLTDADITVFAGAIDARERSCARPVKHYRVALYTSRTVIYHMGAVVTPAATKQTGHLRWPWSRHFDGAAPGIGRSLAAYLNAPPAPGSAPPSWEWPAGSGTSPGSWPGMTRHWPRWPAWTASATSSPTCPRSPRAVNPRTGDANPAPSRRRRS